MDPFYYTFRPTYDMHIPLIKAPTNAVHNTSNTLKTSFPPLIYPFYDKQTNEQTTANIFTS